MIVSKKTARLLSVLGLIQASVAQAGTDGLELSCYRGSCWVDGMPVYSQNDTAIKSSLFPDGDRGRSNLCVPTSASMMLEANIRNSAYYSSGWTWSSFENRSQIAQIENMAALMGTVPASGTDTVGQLKGSAARAIDFVGGKSTTYHSCPSFTRAKVVEHLNQNRKIMVVYGHYNQKVNDYGYYRTVSYERQGGHAIAVGGYKLSGVTFHDPWYAQVIDRAPASRSASAGFVNGAWQAEAVPGIYGSASHLPASGAYFPFIDLYVTLQSR